VQDAPADPLHAFEALAPRQTLEQLFPLHVLTRYSATDVQEDGETAHGLAALQALMGSEITGANRSAREDFAVAANGSSTGGLPGIDVSGYYRRCAASNDRGDRHIVEPCTGVCGEHVLLCIELFFDRSNTIVYRDVRTPLDTPLRTALAVYSQVQGLPPATAYTHMRLTAPLGWELAAFSQAMLDMPLRYLLQHPAVRDSYELDFFRLSPVAAHENSTGILVSLL
jgi:hypothetical protein